MERNVRRIPENPNASKDCFVCQTCKHPVRTIPIQELEQLYKPNFTLSSLLEFILKDHIFFICPICCQILKNSSRLYLRFINYVCFICGCTCSTSFASVKKAMSFNSFYVCKNCLLMVINVSWVYEYLSYDSSPILKSLSPYKCAVTYICEPVIFPAKVCRPFGQLTEHDYVHNANLKLINLEFCCIVVSKKGNVDYTSKLKIQRKALPYLAEVVSNMLNSYIKIALNYDVEEHNNNRSISKECWDLTKSPHSHQMLKDISKAGNIESIKVLNTVTDRSSYSFHRFGPDGNIENQLCSKKRGRKRNRRLAQLDEDDNLLCYEKITFCDDTN